MRVLVYIGWNRPEVEPDTAFRLLENIHQCIECEVKAILRNDDPLISYCTSKQIATITLPDFLTQSISSIKSFIHTIENNRLDGNASKESDDYYEWMKQLENFDPQLGVVIWGNWIPPQIFNMPRFGFINYHPAPLPDYKGYEPETMAIIEARSEMCGTVHRVSEKFDDGDIICYSDPVILQKYETSGSLLIKLAKLAPDTILNAIKIISENPEVKVSDNNHNPGTEATKKRARKESWIRWESDSNEMIHRRYRAFCGQSLDIPLRAEISGRYFQITALETHSVRLEGNPGEFLGIYEGEGRFHGCPIVKTLQGVAILKPGAEFISQDQLESAVDLCDHEVVAPVRMSCTTKIRNILRSINVKKIGFRLRKRVFLKGLYF